MRKIAPAILFLVIFSSLSAKGNDEAILVIHVNTLDKGEHIVQISPEKDVLLTTNSLKQIGLNAIQHKIQANLTGYVSLSSLKPNVSFSIDESDALLFITAKPSLLGKHVISPRNSRRSENILASRYSAFLNYNFQYSADDNGTWETYNIPAELNIKLGKFVGLSSFSYTQDETDNSFARLMSSVSMDNPKKLRRYTLGDVTTGYGTLGSSSVMGGLSIAKNFSMSPYFVKSPGLSLSGVANTPSEIEIYVDDLLIEKRILPPGEFEFLELPAAARGGNSKIIITDAYGQQTELSGAFYISSQLLKPKLHEYNYNLGFKRENYGKENSDYKNLLFYASHMYGFSKNFTSGGRMECDADTLNIGPEAAFLMPGNMGEINTALAYTLDEDQAEGLGGSFSYLYNNKHLSINLSARKFSEEYSTLTIPANSTNKTDLQLSSFLGLNFKRIGTLNAAYQLSSSHDDTKLETYSLGYSRPLFRCATLNIKATRTEEKGGNSEDSIYCWLNIGMKDRSSANISYEYENDLSEAMATLRKNRPSGTGLEYKTSLTERETSDSGWERDGNVDLKYHSQHGIYRANYNSTDGNGHYNTSFAGSISVIDGSLHLSRPIYDSFALVKINNGAGIPVEHNNQHAGKCNQHGKILVPDLISYHDNLLKINPELLPLEVTIKNETLCATPSYRSGCTVNFEASRLQACEGRIFVIQNKQKIPAEYGTFEFQLQGKIKKSIIGLDGEFYLENIPTGSYPAKLFYKGKQYTFNLTIPKSSEYLINLHDIICTRE